MTPPTIEDLARQAAAGDPAAVDLFLARLQGILRLLDRRTLDRVAQSAEALRAGQPPAALPAGPLSPELLEWARQDLNVQEILADLQALREQGGPTLEEMLPDLERIVERR